MKRMYPVSAATSYDVVVIGRGAIGAAAALGMAQSGLRVGIVGPDGGSHADPDGQAGNVSDWDSRVFALSPASRQLLQGLRVWDAMDQSRIAPVFDMRVYPQAGPVESELHFSAYESCVDSLAQIVENRNLIDALNRAIDFAGVTKFESSLASIDPQEKPDALLTLEDGRQLRAHLVIGADGAHSQLRELLAIQADIRQYPQQAVVANFEIEKPHRDCAYQWFGDHGIVALLPLPGNRCSMVWSAPTQLAETLQTLDSTAMASRVAELSGNVLGSMSMITPQQTFALRLIQVPQLVASRVALIGDAAHVVHPLAGQGMNLGFGDLQTLLDVIRSREPFRDLGDPMLLRRYERARREPVQSIKLVTDGLQRLFDPESASDWPMLAYPVQRARDLGWRALESFPWLKRRLIAHAVS
jgi:2-octaprenylphenol hydroxylase